MAKEMEVGVAQQTKRQKSLSSLSSLFSLVATTNANATATYAVSKREAKKKVPFKHFERRMKRLNS